VYAPAGVDAIDSIKDAGKTRLVILERLEIRTS
jgi:hypothetical protein